MVCREISIQTVFLSTLWYERGHAMKYSDSQLYTRIVTLFYFWCDIQFIISKYWKAIHALSQYRHSRPKRTSMLVSKFEKHTLYADSGRKKTPLFKGNRRFWSPIKHPFLSKTRYIFRYIRYKVPSFLKARIIVSNWSIFCMHVIFFVPSNVCLNFKYIYP